MDMEVSFPENVVQTKKEIKIGNTTYVVNCYCSLTKDEIKAKIARLIRNNAQSKS